MCLRTARACRLVQSVLLALTARRLRLNLNKKPNPIHPNDESRLGAAAFEQRRERTGEEAGLNHALKRSQ